MLKSLILAAIACVCLRAQPAALEGTAVNAATGAPLSGVHISLVSVAFGTSLPQPDDAYGAISDASGHYSIHNIRPGAYYLNPSHAGFVYAAEPNLTLNSGQQTADFKIALTPEAVIRGRVLDESGDPVPNVSVVATDSNRTTTMRAETDDHGDYRIHGAPGSYYIEASPPAPEAEAAAPEIRTDGSLGTAYTITYYPGALARTRAQAVDATSAHELTGIDIHIARYHTVKITGTVVTSNKTPVRGVVTLRVRDNEDEASEDVIAGPDGRYEFADLVPGEYQLQAKLPPQREGDPPLASLLVPVVVETKDAAVPLTVTPGEALVGNVQVEDRKDEVLAAWNVHLRPADPAGIAPPGGQVQSDGGFAFPGVIPGIYHVSLEPLPGDDYIKTVKLSGAEVPAGLDLSKGVGRSTLEIDIARDGGEISGSIDTPNPNPGFARRLLAVLVRDPNSIATWRDAPASDGKFAFHGLRPGKYRLFAVDVAQFGGLTTLDPLKSIALNAGEFEVAPNGRVVRNLPLTANGPDAK
ncbi:MAG TPA: carboxypeptidase-like regulatory domain-containing protein [Bryobacteraceae bacterium]|nr:carboxypeptidase-like regulatory domain-containing protein [Bryobacteraceae bacterium]